MTQSPRTGFMVLHSNRMEGLRDLLVAHIRHNPLPPLAAETVLVQSNGMKHWLSVSLAQDDALGICAATHMALPSSQLWQIYRCVLGTDRLPMAMPLDKSPLAWRILRRLPHWLTDPRFAALAHYLGADTGGIRAYHLAQQLADVLDGYQNYRSDWLDQWALCHNSLDRGQSLAPGQAWQADMWRDLLSDVQAQQVTGFQARSEVHTSFLRELKQRQPGSIPGLPPRLMVFGITALPMQTMQALVALGRHLPVLMFVHNPCREHWGHVSEDMSSGGHALLAAWGKQGRDYLHAIDQFEAQDEHSPVYQRVTAFVDPVQEAVDAQAPVSVLQRLQSGLLNLQASKLTDAPPDDSVVFVQTHSAQREVEVLHDRVLGWLNADPQLQPADIMVMVPDMALFAPHIHPVFGRYAGSAQTALDLPYSVTDSTPRSHPLVQAVDSLLQLPQLRCSLSEWLALFQVKAVRERYGLSETDVVQLHEWLAEAGVRWGLDAQQRRQWGMDPALPDAEQNTWCFGLRRLLLGYALGPTSHDAVWQDTAAQPGVDGLDAPLIAGLLQWLEDMNQLEWVLQADRSPQDWLPCMQQMLDGFFKAEDDADQRVLDQLMEPLQDWLADCQMAGLDEPVSLGVLRSHWMAQLDAVGLLRRFAAGGVQFATLMPMRAIPFKVVCLLGMNDSAYPRSPTPRDFDLISHAGNHRPGDRARREDDRYLFLEALLSARQRLYISWQGRRASDHAVLPPSVLVAQLMDYLNPSGQSADAAPKPYTAPLQPLQAFSRSYFQQGSGFATYAAEWATVRQSPAQSLSSPAPGLPPPDQLTEQSLLTLLRQPVEVFFRHHLQVTLDTPQLNDVDNEPFIWSGLQAYVLQQQVLRSDQAQEMLQRMKCQGVLAMAGGGEWQQQQLLDLQHKVLAQFAPWQEPGDSDVPPQMWRMQAHGCSLSLPWGGDPLRWRMHADGSVLHMDMRAGNVLQAENIRLHTLPQLWLGHLSASAAGVRTTSVLSGANGVVCLQPMTAEHAQACLQDLVLLYLEAWARPLPLAIKTAAAFLVALDEDTAAAAPGLQVQSALAQARKVYKGNRFLQGECPSSPYLQRVYPRFDDMDLKAFSALAVRMYAPMRQACAADVTSEQEASA